MHSFSETALGPFFLGFMTVSLLVGIGLLYYRSSTLKSEGEIESVVSRESTFLLNNLLLVGATFAIFLGTVCSLEHPPIVLAQSAIFLSTAIGSYQKMIVAAIITRSTAPIFGMCFS